MLLYDIIVLSKSRNICFFFCCFFLIVFFIIIILNQVKWSGAYQDGAGLTLGEEVEQCNAFLSRIAVTTKHMSKAGKVTYCTRYILIY